MSSFPDLLTSFDEIVQALKVKLSQDASKSTTYNGELIQSIAKDIEDRWAPISAMVQGRASFETKADLLASGAPPAEQLLAEVWLDPTPELNGLYGWADGVWTKSSFGNPINEIFPSDTSQPVTGFAVHENNESKGVNYLLPKQVSRKKIELVDLTANYCSLSENNGEIIAENPNGYCWIEFDPHVNHIETYIKNNGWTRYVGIGSYDSGVIAITLGTGFGNVYHITNTSIKKVDSFDVIDKEMAPSFSSVKISIISDKFIAQLDQDSSGDFVDWLDIDLKDIFPVDEYRLSIASINTSSVTILKDASSVVDSYSQLRGQALTSQEKVDIHDKSISELRLANRSDYSIVQGEGITIKNGELISTRYSGDWPVIMFDEDVTEIEMTCSDEFYGVMLGFDPVSEQGTFVTMGKTSGSRTVADVKGTAFNINTSSLDPESYGVPLQGKTPEKVLNGDKINVKIINDNSVEIKVFRQGSSEVVPDDFLIVDRRIALHLSQDLIGWNKGLQLGVLCLSSGADISLCTQLSIRKKGIQDERNIIPSRWCGKKYYALGDSITGVGALADPLIIHLSHKCV